MIQKSITFVYHSKVTKQAWEPLADEARRRGYEVLLTDQLRTPTEIGFYCSHDNHPEHAKFSLIMFHGMDQGRARWPNMWIKEPWNKYDVGLLPGPSWVERWQKCSRDPFVHPRKGVFQAGWPKADLIFNPAYGFSEKVKQLQAEMDLPYEKTVLYAPSFETDGKQDDVVNALGREKVNILIKHWVTEYERKGFPDIWENITAANARHLQTGPHVRVLDPGLSIMHCLGLSNLLITDESSVAYEALLLDVPTLSVSDWVMRTDNASLPRPIQPPKDVVFMTSRQKLGKTAKELLNSPHSKKSIQAKRNSHYAYLGESAKRVLDIIDAHVNGGQAEDRIVPRHKTDSGLIMKRSIVNAAARLARSRYIAPLWNRLEKTWPVNKFVQKVRNTRDGIHD